MDTLKHLDNEILELTEEANVEDKITQADSFKEGTYSATVKIDKLCATTPPPSSGTPPHGDTAHTTKAPNTRVRKATQANYTNVQWRHHNLDHLSDINKFNYLMSPGAHS